MTDLSEARKALSDVIESRHKTIRGEVRDSAYGSQIRTLIRMHGGLILQCLQDAESAQESRDAFPPVTAW